MCPTIFNEKCSNFKICLTFKTFLEFGQYKCIEYFEYPYQGSKNNF